MAQTVLIVEDSENVAENLEVVLTTIAGITVMIVPSGREALKLLVNGDCELAAS